MRLVDADALFESFESHGWYDNRDRDDIAEELLLNATTIDAVPVVRGEWTTNSDYPDTVICSLCGWRESVWWADKGTNYCPNCGARMDGEE